MKPKPGGKLWRIKLQAVDESYHDNPWMTIEVYCISAGGWQVMGVVEAVGSGVLVQPWNDYEPGGIPAMRLAEFYAFADAVRAAEEILSK